MVPKVVRAQRGPEPEIDAAPFPGRTTLTLSRPVGRRRRGFAGRVFSLRTRPGRCGPRASGIARGPVRAESGGRVRRYRGVRREEIGAAQSMHGQLCAWLGASPRQLPAE